VRTPTRATWQDWPDWPDRLHVARGLRWSDPLLPLAKLNGTRERVGAEGAFRTTFDSLALMAETLKALDTGAHSRPTSAFSAAGSASLSFACSAKRDHSRTVCRVRPAGICHRACRPGAGHYHRSPCWFSSLDFLCFSSSAWHRIEALHSNTPSKGLAAGLRSASFSLWLRPRSDLGADPRTRMRA
jgi:hypothetical protein